MVRAHPGPRLIQEADMAEEKRGGKMRKLFLLALIGGLIGAITTYFRRRRGQDLEEGEWQELPPPEGV